MILLIILIAIVWGLSLMVSYNRGRLMQIKKDNKVMDSVRRLGETIKRPQKPVARR